MATKTTVVNKYRCWDHVYDTQNYVSSPTDFVKLTMKGPSTSDPAAKKQQTFTRVVNYDAMFSDLWHHPRAYVKMGTTGVKLPDHINPYEQGEKANDVSNSVDGAARFKYFRRPVINPGLVSSMAANAVLAPQGGQGQQQHNVYHGHQGGQGTEELPATRDAGTQSLYRESDAQTDAYTPEYIIAAGQDPEVLALSHMTSNNGALPAGLREVEIIERMRQRRLFDVMLPPSTDEFSFNLRGQLMEKQEIYDMSLREKKISELQARRLEVVKELLEQRTVERKQHEDAKVDRLREKNMSDKDKFLVMKTQHRRRKIKRRFDRAARAIHINDNEKDVIAQHVDCSSSVYAQKYREGIVPSRRTAKMNITPADLKTFPSLLQFEHSMPADELRVDLTEPNLVPSRKKQKELDALARALERTLEDKSNVEDVKGASGLDAIQVGGAAKRAAHLTRLERPETPMFSQNVLLPEQEERETAILMVQRLLRGRANQNVMFEGKEKRLDLINELRLVESWKGAGEEDGDANDAFEQLQEKALREGILEGVEGAVLSQTLDTLSKELVRFQEEKRIAVMVKFAERHRRLRQASESGRRQAEERLRDREDEMFRQIMGVHQATVDSYLEDVLTTSVQQAAKAKVLTEAKLRATKINKVVDELEEQNQSAETVCRQLMGQFLLPYVNRQVLQSRIKTEEKRFPKVARATLADTIDVCKDKIGPDKGLKDTESLQGSLQSVNQDRDQYISSKPAASSSNAK